jgi:recombination protein RecT
MNAKPPTSAVAVIDKKAAYATIEAEYDRNEARIVASLAQSIPPERFRAVALQGIARQPKLLECTTASILRALIDAAELGLEPSGLLGSAYLVPYRNRKTGRYEAQLIPGYRGLIGLARRSGEIRTIEAQVVRERDEFSFAYGTDKYLTHRPYLNTTGERGFATIDDRGETVAGRLLDRGAFIAAYAIAVLSTGEQQFHVMDASEIEAIRRRSKAADNGPWVTDTAEMWRKSPTRNLLKYLPLSVTALQRALSLEDEAEGGAIVVRDVSPARTQLQDALGMAPETAPEATEPDEDDNDPSGDLDGVDDDLEGDEE